MDLHRRLFPCLPAASRAGALRVAAEREYEMTKRFWRIKGYRDSKTIIDERVPFGCMTERQLQELLKCLMAKEDLHDVATFRPRLVEMCSNVVHKNCGRMRSSQFQPDRSQSTSTKSTTPANIQPKIGMLLRASQSGR
jgi:hypothetical protein